MGAPAEVALEPGALVIGDLHLDLEEEASLAPFLGWLRAAAGAPRVVVLGDLFEYWIGGAQARTPGGRRVVDALRACVRGGTAVDVIPGNRDFLLDASFERATGCRVRRDGLIGTLAPPRPAPGREVPARRVLFVHGDELATRDVRYQRLRRVLRARATVWLAGRLPLAVTRAVARRLRRASRRALARKAPPETELQAEACGELARRSGADVLVCGHAHRFRDETVGGVRWLVVDAFGGARDTLEVGPDGELGVRGGGAGDPRNQDAPG